MGWDQVGALFTIGCFVFAGLTLVFQIWPLPWRRPNIVAPGQWVQSGQPRFSKLMAAFIVVGFLASGLTLWAAWHPQQPVSTFQLPSQAKLERVEGRIFLNETVEIDGKEFRHCRFVNVRLSFHGNQTAIISDDTFSGTSVLATDNVQSQAFGELLGNFGILKQDNEIRWGSDDKGFWSARIFPSAPQPIPLP